MQLVRSRPPASTTLCGFRTDLLPQGRGQGSSLRRGRYGEATGAHSIPVSGVSAYHAHHGNDDDLSRRRDPRICTVYAARAAARPFGARGGLWALCTGALCTGPSAPNSHRMRSWFLVKPYSTRDPHALKLAGTSEHHVRINCTVQRSTAASSLSEPHRRRDSRRARSCFPQPPRAAPCRTHPRSTSGDVAALVALTTRALWPSPRRHAAQLLSACAV